MENSAIIRNVKELFSADEYIVWQGRPEGKNVFSKQDVFMIPFSLVWCGFAIFWVIGVLSSGAGIMAIFGIPFVAVGLYLVFGRFIHQASKRSKTDYVITNKRIFILCGSNITSLERETIKKIDIKMHRDGSGTVIINDEGDIYYSGYVNRRTRYIKEPFALEHIKEATKVYKILTTDLY